MNALINQASEEMQQLLDEWKEIVSKLKEKLSYNILHNDTLPSDLVQNIETISEFEQWMANAPNNTQTASIKKPEKQKPKISNKTSTVSFHILNEIMQAGGQLTKSDTLSRLRPHIKIKRGNYPSKPHTPKWHIDAETIVGKLVKAGFIKRDSGVWSITAFGQNHLATLKQQ